MLIEPLHVERGPRPGTWRLTARLVYRDRELGEIIVPAGFVSDLESVPGWLPVAYVLLREAAPEAGVLHDWLYWTQRTGGREITQADADRVLYEAALATGTPPWRAWALWLGVRAGGWVVWRRRAGGAPG